MSEVIDLNSLLPEGAEFKPLFESNSAYQEFRKRYEREMVPALEELASKRRRSEEEARRRLVG